MLAPSVHLHTQSRTDFDRPLHTENINISCTCIYRQIKHTGWDSNEAELSHV